MPYIQNDEKSIRSSLARARNHGSAKDGTHHWWMQRVTAIALVPLTIWMLSCLDCLLSQSFEHTVIWLNTPFVAITLGLFVIVVFYHAALGIQVVIEDYVHKKAAKVTALLLTHFAFFAMAAACLFSLLIINFKTNPFSLPMQEVIVPQ